MPSDDGAAKPNFSMMTRNMRALITTVGFPNFSNMDEGEAHIYDRIRLGRCMTCGSLLGKDANLIVTRHGIVGGYCNGICHTDMAVLGWLQEQHEELTQRIEFREGKHNPDKVDAESTAEDDDAEA